MKLTLIQHDRPGGCHKMGAAKSSQVAGAWGYLGKWQLVEGKRGWPQASVGTLCSLKPSPCELWSLRKGPSSWEQWLQNQVAKAQGGKMGRVFLTWLLQKRLSLSAVGGLGLTLGLSITGDWCLPDGEVVCPQDEAQSNYFSIKFLFLFLSPFSLLTSFSPVFRLPSFLSAIPSNTFCFLPMWRMFDPIPSLFTTELSWRGWYHESWLWLDCYTVFIKCCL